MSLLFANQMEAVARRIERRRRAATCCWLVAAGTIAALALVTADWAIGVHRLPARLSLTGLLLAAIYAAWRWRSTARPAATPLSVALQLEDRYPQYRSLLASGVEFSRQADADATTGSADLRRAVVLRAAVATESLDVHSIVPLSPLRWALAVCALAGVLVATAAFVSPSGVAAGIARLLVPWSRVEYPRTHDLTFVDLPRIAPAGSDFAATLSDRNGRLPASVEVQFRTYRDGQWHEDAQTYPGGPNQLIQIRRANVQESFELRAVGGDHQSMSWRRIEVAPPPQLLALKVRVHPPAYSHLPSEVAGDPAPMLAGSRLEACGRVSLPVASGVLRNEGERSVPLVIAADGMSFSTPPADWTPRRTGSWSLYFTTRQGMAARLDQQVRVEVIPDRPPTAEIVYPAENLAVLPEAVIELAFAIEDDLAVRAAELVLRTHATSASAPQGDAGDQHVDIFPRDERPKPGSKHVTYSLALSDFALPAGARRSLLARAEDSAGQTGQSVRPLLLHVITPEEFSRQVGAQLSQLHNILQRAADQQRRVSQRIAAWQAMADGQPSREEREALFDRQRRLRDAVGGEHDSAAAIAQSLVAQYQRNRWPDAAAARRADRLLRRLQGLRQAELEEIEAALTAFAREASRGGADAALSNPQQQALANARARQQGVIESLQSALDELAQWSDSQQLQQELTRLQAAQEGLLARTGALARAALAGRPEEPDAPLNEQALRAAGEQLQLAEQLGAALDRARQAAAAGASPSSDAARLQAALDHAEQGRAQAEARAAAEHLADQRFGEAAQSQRRASEQLQQALAELAAGIGPLEQLDAALKQLTADQGSLASDLQRLRWRASSAPSPDGHPSSPGSALAARQAEIRERATRQSRESAALPVFARLLTTAAGTMEGVERELLTSAVRGQAVELAEQAHKQLRRLAEAVHEQAAQRWAAAEPLEDTDKKSAGAKRPPVNSNELQAMRLVLAQLGVLRNMQAELRGRTIELERRFAAGGVSAADRDLQAALLADEQKGLADMADALREASAGLPADASDDPLGTQAGPAN
ncbi:MAG: hypothetical protein IT424_07995 [Pirellulales bacterium]|nr:hypothetical protein [Pirellulales bacterium]